MHRLTVVAGKIEGDREIQLERDLTVGRDQEADVRVHSGKVSRKHAQFHIISGGACVRDLGSANGTFVNGAKIGSERKLVSGDRIVIGDCVVVYTRTNQDLVVGSSGSSSGLDLSPEENVKAVQKKLTTSDRMDLFFDQKVFPILRGFTELYDWKIVAAVIFLATMIGATLFGVYPLIMEMEASLVREAGRRAVTVAKQIRSDNTRLFQERAFSRLTLEATQSSSNIVASYITDATGKVMAPASEVNSSVPYTFEAEARNVFVQNPDRQQIFREIGNGLIGAAVPIQLVSQNTGVNATVGIIFVFMSVANIKFDFVQVLMMLVKTGIVAVLFGSVFVWIFLKFAEWPFRELKEKLDIALTGGVPEFEKRLRHPTYHDLVDSIGQLISKMHAKQHTMGDPSSRDSSQGLSIANAHEILDTRFKQFVYDVNIPMMAVDERGYVKLMNNPMGELLGTREEICRDSPISNYDSPLGMNLDEQIPIAKNQDQNGVTSFSLDKNGISFLWHIQCWSLDPKNREDALYLVVGVPAG